MIKLDVEICEEDMRQLCDMLLIPFSEYVRTETEVQFILRKPEPIVEA